MWWLLACKDDPDPVQVGATTVSERPITAGDADRDGYGPDVDCDDSDPRRWWRYGTRGDWLWDEGSGAISPELRMFDCAVTCWEHEGSLTFVGVDAGILERLSCLYEVEGGLTIQDSPALVDLAPLRSLRGAGAVTLTRDAGLTSLEGLERLTALAGLRLEDDDALVSLFGLGAAPSSSLSIVGSDALVDLSGLAPITALGALTLESNASLVSVAGLASLESVRGDLRIADAPALTNVELRALTEVGGTLAIEGAGALTDLSGFGALESVDDLEMRDLASITDVSGFGALRHGKVTIEDAPALADVSGFGAFESFAGGVTVADVVHVVSGDDVVIEQVPSLRALTGFRGVRSIGGHLIVSGLPLETLGLPFLESVTGPVVLTGLPALALADFPSLVAVGGLTLQADPQLDSLGGFSSLETITGDLELFGLTELRTLGGLERVVSVDGIAIAGCPALSSISMLAPSSLRSLTLDGNAALEHLADYPQVGELDSVSVAYNATLRELDILGSAITLDGDLRIVGNPLLQQVSGFIDLTEVGGAVVIENNAALEGIAGLGAMSSAGSISIAMNPALADLGGLQSLTSVAGAVYLADDDALVHLEPLRALTSIGLGLTIEENDRLTDVSGLSNVPSVGGDLILRENRCLPAASATELLDAIGEADVYGSVVVSGNDGPC